MCVTYTCLHPLTKEKGIMSASFDQRQGENDTYLLAKSDFTKKIYYFSISQ